MRIVVDSNFSIFTMKNVFAPPVELHFEGGTLTLKDLLEELNDICPSIQFLEDGDPGEDVCDIFLNGKRYLSLPQVLNTPLNDGDKVKVEIYMDLLGGG